MGGAFSLFPALFLSTMIITYLEHGWEFSAALMKTFMFGAAVTVPIYGIAVRYSYPAFGLLLGTLLSLVITLENFPNLIIGGTPGSGLTILQPWS